jgi:hypothetical protein
MAIDPRFAILNHFAARSGNPTRVSFTEDWYEGNLPGFAKASASAPPLSPSSLGIGRASVYRALEAQ